MCFQVFMTTTVLYNLLHPPPVSVSEEPSTSLSLTLTSRGMARSSREEQEEASEGRSEVGPEVSTPPTDASQVGPHVHYAHRRIRECSCALPKVSPAFNAHAQSSQLELGWDNKFHTYRRKFFSDVSSLLSGANWSSVEKLKRYVASSTHKRVGEIRGTLGSRFIVRWSLSSPHRFQKRSAGIDIPELYKGRYERDLNYMK